MLSMDYLKYKISFIILLTMGLYSEAQVIATGDTILCEGQEGNVGVTLTATAFAVDLIDSNIYTDDIFGGIIDMGFDFEFYGNTYSQVVLASNNYLSFNTANAGGYSDWTIGAAIPTQTEPETQNGILCPWQDIYPGVNGNGTIAYATIGEAPNRIFIVSFCGIPMFSCTDICYTSQIKLFETTNVIETHIAEKVLCTTWNSGAAIHGLHNIDGTIAHVVTGADGIERNYPNAWTCEDDGWRFTPNGDDDYILEEIEFYPAVSGTDITWQDEFGNIIGTGPEIIVYPGGDVEYTVGASLCGDAGDWCGFEGGVGGTDVNIVFEELTLTASPTDITCYNENNGSIEVFAPNEGDWTYSLYENDNLINSQESNSDTYLFENLEPGLYAVTIETPDCVSDELALEITQPNQIESVTIINDVLCNGANSGEIEIIITGGTAPYNTILGNSENIITSLIGETITFPELSAGDYYFSTIDDNGCLIPGDEVFFTITEPEILTIATDVTGTSCYEGSDGQAEYTIEGGNPPYDIEDEFNLTSGEYTTTVTDANGCEAITDFTINQPDPLSIESEVGNAACEDAQNGFIQINVSGGTAPYNYEWSTENGFDSNDANINNLYLGVYNLLITDNNNCSYETEINVSTDEAMVIDPIWTECINGNDGQISANIIGGNPPYSYQISEINTGLSTSNNSGTFNNLGEGEYLIETIDNFGCVEAVIINLNSAPIADFDIDEYQFYLSNTPTEFTNLTNDTNVIDWLWDFGDNNTSTLEQPTHLYTSPGIYIVQLEVVDEFGCTDIVNKEITILQDHYAYTPDVFTPNNDGVNDVFRPSLLYINKSTYVLTIVDRWGGEVFKTTDYNEGWDGTLKNGTLLDPDVYSYRILYQTNLGETKEQKGSILMAR